MYQECGTERVDLYQERGGVRAYEGGASELEEGYAGQRRVDDRYKPPSSTSVCTANSRAGVLALVRQTA
eukprot:3315131-Rhodomonas_salina.1